MYIIQHKRANEEKRKREKKNEGKNKNNAKRKRLKNKSVQPRERRKCARAQNMYIFEQSLQTDTRTMFAWLLRPWEPKIVSMWFVYYYYSRVVAFFFLNFDAVIHLGFVQIESLVFVRYLIRCSTISFSLSPFMHAIPWHLKWSAYWNE